MPETDSKQPAWLRVAEGMYSTSLGSTRRSEIIAAMEKSWEDDELFIPAHLLYLNLQAQAEIYQQNREVIALLKRLVRQGRNIEDALDELGEVITHAAGEEEQDDEDLDLEDDAPAESPVAEPAELVTPAEVVAPAEAPRRKGKKVLAHPEPAEGGED